MSKKDEVKSLVNSINMVRNMVESIVAAVQDRFKDYDNVIVTLKERLDRLESQTSGGDVTGIASPDMSAFSSKVDQLVKRIDSLNERLLLIEATKSVHEEAMVAPTDVEAIKDIAEKEMKVEPTTVLEAPPTPVPLPEAQPESPIESTLEPVPIEEPIESAPIEPDVELLPEPKAEIPTPPVAPTALPTEVPTAPPAPTPATQVSETVERDVSPISKEVSGTIPMPPKQAEPPTPQQIQPIAPKEETDPSAPEEGKSAELFGEAVSGDKAELLKALKKLEDL
ncbi:MAG: hypothetical protein ACFFDS_01770 [Candidatus Thorarchaeota archaeon]